MARRNIVERYSRADVGKRVEIILDNYGIVTGQLSVLQKEEYDLYLPYINGEKGCFEIAADEGISPDAVRMRLHRYRTIVKESSIPFMESLAGLSFSKCA